MTVACLSKKWKMWCWQSCLNTAEFLILLTQLYCRYFMHTVPSMFAFAIFIRPCCSSLNKVSDSFLVVVWFQFLCFWLQSLFSKAEIYAVFVNLCKPALDLKNFKRHRKHFQKFWDEFSSLTKEVDVKFIECVWLLFLNITKIKLILMQQI